MNSPSEKPIDKPAKKPLFIIAAIVVSLIVILSGGIIYLTLWRVPDNRKEVERIRNETIEKIEEGNAVPKEDNAWFTYNDAFAKFKNYIAGQSDHQKIDLSLIDSTGLNRDNIEALRQCMKDCEPILHLSREAYRQKSFQIPRNYTEGSLEKMPDFLTIRSFIFLLALNGDLLAKEGKFEEAAELYMQGLHLGTGIGQNGTLLMGMISIAAESIVFRHLISFIKNYNLNEKTCLFLIEEISRWQKERTSFINWMDNEAVFIHYTLKLLRTGRMKSQGQMDRLYAVRWFMDREERVYENQFLKDRSNTAQNYRKACEAMPDDMNTAFPPFTIIAKILYPNYKRAYKQDVLAKTQYGGILLAAALKLHKMEKGKYPDSLSQLTPGYLKEIPSDPYSPDGQFMYIKKGDEVKLYSIAPDMKDEGGKAGTSDRNPEAMGDIVYYTSPDFQ